MLEEESQPFKRILYIGQRTRYQGWEIYEKSSNIWLMLRLCFLVIQYWLMLLKNHKEFNVMNFICFLFMLSTVL